MPNMANKSSNGRDAILREATRLFAKNGFEGTSLQAIADAVGMRKPSLLYHFQSKEALRDQVIQQIIDHWKTELPQLLSKATDERDRFSNTISGLVGFFVEDQNRATLALREVLDRPNVIRDLIREQLGPWIQLVVDYIRLGQRLELVRPEVDCESYIIQVIIMVLGTVAASAVSCAIYANDDQHRLEANTQELIRIAGVALFKHFEPNHISSTTNETVTQSEKTRRG